ncbi:conjugal transfer protein TraG N-terminal domain-containing protein [Trichlorobacter lovleyi]|uniref:conjugal transfer protein TraG N-terminal domain-containing protein n=1 Tax=Trichlorobacter lovleyi TaxID=313985 RepID=UPI003D0E50DE
MKKLLFIALILIPAQAQAALTQEYYCWGGHDAVVSAFNKIALIFGGSGYQSLFITLATASIAALVIRVMMQLMLGGFKGDGNVAFHALIPWLLSVSIFAGGVIPKGTLHIYDPVENKYQAVGGIPDVVILFASISNKIERVLVEQVTTSGDPIGFQAQAGGKGFMGLYSISTIPVQANDSMLDTSVQRYIGDCVGFHSSIEPGYIQELRKTTSDLLTSFAKAASPANMTVLFSDSSPAGDSVSCRDAWTSIQTRLQVAGGLQNNLKTACTEMGFNPEIATEFNDCQTKMSSVVNAQIQPGKTSMDFLRSVYLAQSMDDVLSSDNAGAAMSNFSILNKASGTMSTVNNWLPTVRAVILAVTISLTPFLALLMLTPMFGKALKFVAGSFFLLTIFGVVDATLHQFIIDYSSKLYADVRQYGMGLDALRFFPSSTEKVLAMFGMVRASGLVLAGYIASNVVGLSASVGAAIGGKLMGDAVATGAQAEQQMLDPGQKSALRRSNQMSIPTETLANNYSMSQRTTADYAQQMGQLENITGSLESTGGMSGWGKLQHGQGFTNAYRGQGDVKLNQQFMAQADSMGIPKEAAQQMAAATVNHGEGLAELRRLQAQGYTAQQAADTYWQGKTVDHMQGKSVGQQDGFSMYRPTAGQETGRWGQVNATWQNGEMVGLQGNSVSVVDTDSIRAGYDKSFGQALSETRKAEQSVGEGITKSWGSSGTWSQVTAAAQQLYTATSGTVDWSKSLNSSVVSSLRNSTAVDERTGQTIDKSAWASITAGAGTPAVSPIKANIEGGASWRITTSDGKSYTVHQSAEQARSTQEQIGQSWRTTSTQVRSGNYSSTAQKALAQIESVTGTRTASESASRSYQEAHDINERRNEALSRAAETRTSLDRDFYSYVGQQQFGGGGAGDRQAIKHLEGLASSGQTAEINKLREQYYQARGINPKTLGQGLPDLKKPDVEAIASAVQSIDAKIDAGNSKLKQELHNQPDLKTHDPSKLVSEQLQTKPGAVDPKEIQQGLIENKQLISEGKKQIEDKGHEIKQSPVEKLHAAAADAGKRSGELTLQAAETWNNSVPGQIVSGLSDAVPKIVGGLNSLSSTKQSEPQPQDRKSEPQPQAQASTQQLAEAVTKEPTPAEYQESQPHRPDRHAAVQPETKHQDVPAQPQDRKPEPQPQAQASSQQLAEAVTKEPTPAEYQESQPHRPDRHAAVQPETKHQDVPARPQDRKPEPQLQAQVSSQQLAAEPTRESVVPQPSEQNVEAKYPEVQPRQQKPEAQAASKPQDAPAQQDRRPEPQPQAQASSQQLAEAVTKEPTPAEYQESQPHRPDRHAAVQPETKHQDVPAQPQDRKPEPQPQAQASSQQLAAEPTRESGAPQPSERNVEAKYPEVPPRQQKPEAQAASKPQDVPAQQDRKPESQPQAQASTQQLAEAVTKEPTPAEYQESQPHRTEQQPATQTASKLHEHRPKPKTQEQAQQLAAELTSDSADPQPRKQQVQSELQHKNPQKERRSEDKFKDSAAQKQSEQPSRNTPPQGGL